MVPVCYIIIIIDNKTPRIFPNKSEYWKLLFGIIPWQSSKIIEILNKYIKSIFTLFFSEENTPKMDKTKKA